MDGQSYDSLRYELGVDTGYTFNYGGDQALTPYFKLAYVYDDADNNADVNGDSIDNGVKGSAVRVGLGTVQLHQELQCLHGCHLSGRRRR
jgi:outer membrane autotransporter protein